MTYGIRCLIKQKVNHLSWRELTSEAVLDRPRSKKALVAELKDCQNLNRGKHIHEEAKRCGADSCKYVATTLVKMYANCGGMVEAHQVFNSIKQPDVMSWTALILGYAQNGVGETALDLFERMKTQGCNPDRFTFVAAIKACTSLTVNCNLEDCKERGKQIHSEIGDCLDVYVQSTLVHMYAKCGAMVDAQEVFRRIQQPDLVSWNALILGYAENGAGETALVLFVRMRSERCDPNAVTFVAAVKACTTLALEQDARGKIECLERGRKLHCLVGCHLNNYVQSTLIDMYSKCGKILESRRVFDTMRNPDLAAWNALIMGYAENGHGFIALDLFSRLRSPDSISVVAALKACTCLVLDEDEIGRLECMERARQILSNIGGRSNVYIQNTLIDMYSKCGNTVEARRVFDVMERRNVVSWNALILAYVDNGDNATALSVFASMRAQGYVPNSITFVSALKACGSLAALESGRKIHAEMDPGKERRAILVTALVDFYAKCGNLADAQRVFDTYPRTRDLRTWTALLSGYSRFGDTSSAFRLFQGIRDAGLQPDGVTFLCMLACCNHAGLVEKAHECFESMSQKYGITPGVEHYTCMVDIFCRSNKLNDAEALLRRMPWRPRAVTWMIVLGACWKLKNVEIGRLAFQSLVSLDDGIAVAYVLMAQIYGSRGMWEEQGVVLEMKRRLNAWSECGYTCWTNDSSSEVQTFFVQSN